MIGRVGVRMGVQNGRGRGVYRLGNGRCILYPGWESGFLASSLGFGDPSLRAWMVGYSTQQ